MICAYPSVARLVGLLLNALAGWWWADPAAALVIAALAATEGVEGVAGRALRLLLTSRVGNPAIAQRRRLSAQAARRGRWRRGRGRRSTR